MTRKRLIEEYYGWLCEIVCETKNRQKRYSKLLEYLDSVPFNYILDRDGNRA